MPRATYLPETVTAASNRLAAAKENWNTELQAVTAEADAVLWRLIRIELDGPNLLLDDVAEALGVTYQHLYQQLAHKAPPSTEPEQVAAAKRRINSALWRQVRIELDRQTLRVEDAAEALGRTPEYVHHQLDREHLPGLEPQQVDAAKDRITAAKKNRDKNLARELDRINRKFWRAVRAEISAKNLRQADAVSALGFSREHIRTQTARYAANQGTS